MHIVLGATGHVGSALARTLLDRSEPVTIVSRDAEKAEPLRKAGAKVATVDISNSDALREVFRTGRRAFLLNPPADPSKDTDVEEKKSIAAILAALDGSGLEKVVAQSVIGARKGKQIGDIGILFELEAGLRNQKIPAVVVRAGYFMSNWDMALETARKDGTVASMLPADFVLPMVAPVDLGIAAARQLLEPPGPFAIHNVEGPERYCPNDVAAAFSQVLGRRVTVNAAPRAGWVDAFKAIGFSEEAATSYAGMTAEAVDTNAPDADTTEHGKVSLQEYITKLVERPRERPS